MQKNKKLLYILIPGTLLLWGIIVFKIYNAVGGDHDDKTFVQNSLAADSVNEVISDTFSIHPDYRDPFLEGKIVKHTSVQNTIPAVSSVPKKTVMPVASTWPQITYSGMIKNQKSNKQLVLIQINGRSATIKAGDVIDGIVITKVFRDSIEVMMGKEKRFIRK